MLTKEQINALNEKISKGDKEAERFMIDYPSMSAEEANDYLTKLATSKEETNEVSDLGEMNKFLIKDENEAINGYDKAILLSVNVKTPKGEKSKAIYEAIKADEIKHIEMLKSLDEEEPKTEEAKKEVK